MKGTILGFFGPHPPHPPFFFGAYMVACPLAIDIFIPPFLLRSCALQFLPHWETMGECLCKAIAGCILEKKEVIGALVTTLNTSVCCENLFVTMPHDALEKKSGFLQDLYLFSLCFLVSSQPFHLSQKGPTVRDLEEIFLEHKFFSSLKQVPWDTPSSPLTACGVTGDDD